MERNYLSGAQKRKQRAKKIEVEQEVLKKVPKIATLFENQNKRNKENETIADTEEIIEKQSDDTEKVDEEETDHQIDVSNEIVPSSSQILDYSTDPASWDIQNNQSTLQTYWTKHGM